MEERVKTMTNPSISREIAEAAGWERKITLDGVNYWYTPGRASVWSDGPLEPSAGSLDNLVAAIEAEGFKRLTFYGYGDDGPKLARVWESGEAAEGKGGMCDHKEGAMSHAHALAQAFLAALMARNGG